MDNVVLYHGSEDYVRNLGKPSGETDIKYYHTKHENSEISILYPFKFPERVQPLINSASVANRAILEIKEIDRALGELLLVLDYYGIKDVGLLAEDDVYSNIEKFSKSLSFKLIKIENNMGSYLEFLNRSLSVQDSKNTIVIVDQAFPVKGVGTVVLGFVQSGKVKRHQELRAYPSGKDVEVRSIQIMDIDREEASPYSRVGLALKGVEVDDVQKGTILSDNLDFELDESIELNFYNNKTIKAVPEVNEKVQINFGFSNVNAQISDIEDDSILIDCDKKIPRIPEMKYSITDLNRSPRILGVGKIGD